MNAFTLTENHLKLLRRMNVGWQDAEYGAPEIDPKRPYGNSDVELDIAEILGWEVDEDGLSEFQSNSARELHEEMATALQVVLFTGKFKSGVYKREGYSNIWTEL